MAVRNAGQALAQTGVRANLSTFAFQSGFDVARESQPISAHPTEDTQAGVSSTLRLVGIAADDPADAGALVLPRFAAAPFQDVVGANTNTVADKQHSARHDYI